MIAVALRENADSKGRKAGKNIQKPTNFFISKINVQNIRNVMKKKKCLNKK